MNIVIAPDSFKESLSAIEVAQTIAQGFKTVFPNANYALLPVGDGGEGTLDALVDASHGLRLTTTVHGPLGDDIDADWGLINKENNGIITKIGVIELAQASGLAIDSPEDRDVARASTYGTGELIAAALDHGVDQIILCLGGSATNDGGAGIAQALGADLKDIHGRAIGPGAKGLAALDSISLSNIHPRLQQVEFLIACDVDNPLCGDAGASAVFGPQKGATPKQVKDFDSALRRFARIAEPHIGVDHHDSTGFGAAGGAALGLSLLLHNQRRLQLKSGVDIVLEAVGLESHLTNANLVITGEGQMDFQTLYGKTPFGVAMRAKKFGLPVIGLAGSLGENLEGLDDYFDAVFGTVRSPQNLEQVLDEAEANLFQRAASVAQVLKLKL